MKLKYIYLKKNPPANTGDTGLIPGPGRSHMPWGNWDCVPQISILGSRVQEPQLLKPVHLKPALCNKKSHLDDRITHLN